MVNKLSNKRFLKIAHFTFVGLMIGVGFLLITPKVTALYDTTQQYPTKPKYAPGELIIKLKGNAANLINTKLAGSSDLSVIETRTPSLDNIPLSYNLTVESITPVFKTIKHKELTPQSLTFEGQVAQIKARFPQRTARADENLPIPDLSRIYKITFKEKDANILNICQKYLEDRTNVEYAEPNYIAHIMELPNDTHVNPSGDGETWSTGAWGQNYEDMWGLKKINWQPVWENRNTLWTDPQRQGGGGVVVAVIDTGLDYNHEDIQGNVWANEDEVNGMPGVDDDRNGYVDDVRGWDFATCAARDPFSGECVLRKLPDNDPMDAYGHGTHVSGTIAASADNEKGLAGVAWQAKVMSAKGFDDFGFGETKELVEAIVYAVDNGADVINNSWGGSHSQLKEEVIDYAYGLGCVIVASAGNSSSDASHVSPAGLPKVITVASTNVHDGLSFFSNYGPPIDVAAPGGSLEWEFIQHPRAMGGRVARSYHQASFCFWGNELTHWDPLPDLVLHTVLGPDQGRAIVAIYLTDYEKELIFTMDNYAPETKWGKRFIIPLSEYDYAPIGWRIPMIAVVINVLGEGDGSEHYVTIDALEYDGVLYQEGWLEYGDGPNKTGRDILSLKARMTDMYDDNSSFVGQNYYRARGTSMAAPHVSGAAALVLSLHAAESGFTNSHVKSAICTSASDLMPPGRDDSYGYGLLNVYGAIMNKEPIVLPFVYVTSPSDGEIIRENSLDIVGTAVAESGYFRSYELSYAVDRSDGSPVVWEEIGVSTKPVESGRLYRWDHSNINDGYYHLRCSVTSLDPQELTRTLVESHERFVRLGKMLKQPWPIPVEDHCTSPVIADIDPGFPGKEIIVAVDYILGDSLVYAWHSNGSLVPGWPVVFSHGVYSNSAPPAVADVDNDGYQEIFVTARPRYLQDGHIYAWNHDGSGLVRSDGVFATIYNGFASTPSIANLDEDPDLEIVSLSAYNPYKLFVFKADGSILWEAQLNEVSYYPPALGDFDPNYPGTEIVVAPGWFRQLSYVFHADGTMMEPWPIEIGGAFQPPVLGDVDEDGDLEMIVSCHLDKDKIVILKKDPISEPPVEIELPGEPSTLGLADLDTHFPGLEIVVGIGDRFEEEQHIGHGLIYVFHGDGTTVDGWPIEVSEEFIEGVYHPVSTGAAIADIDGDSDLEIVLGSGEGIDSNAQLNAFHHDGTPVEGFPIHLGSDHWVSSVSAIADIDEDGRLEIAVSVFGRAHLLSGGQFVFPTHVEVLDLPYDSYGELAWPTFQHDPQHTGCYTTPLPNLLVSDISFHDGYGNPPQPGERLAATITVRNSTPEVRLSTWTKLRVTFEYHQNPTNPNYTWIQWIHPDDLNSDGTAELRVGPYAVSEWWQGEQGLRTIKVELDPDNLIEESDENDNTKTAELILVPSNVNIIYVDGTNGNDSNDGLSPTQAKQTIRAGITQANPDYIYIIRVLSGVYHEGWINLKGGIILYGQDPKTTIIDASGLGGAVVHIEPGWGEYLFNSGEAVISGFTIMGSAQRYEGIRISHCSPVIKNCIIKDNYHGIFNYGDASPKITNNVIAKNTYAGIRTSTFEGASSDIIKNNIILQNNIGIWAQGSSSPTLSYNDVWSNNSNYSGVTASSSDISADPLFVDTSQNDYHLQPGSPCIDTGDPQSNYTDLDGSRNDIGAYGDMSITDELDFIGTTTPAQLTLLSPQDNMVISTDSIVVSGSVEGANTTLRLTVDEEKGNRTKELLLKPKPRGASDFSEEVSLFPGKNKLVLEASNIRGEATLTRSIKVNRKPDLKDIGNKTTQEAKELTFTISAADPDDGDSLSYSASNLPQGTQFNTTTHKFTWTPTYEQAGTYPNIRFEVTDGNGGSDFEDIQITVIDVNRNPVIKARCFPIYRWWPRLWVFISQGTYDPDKDRLTFLWEFGDGNKSSKPNTFHLYRKPGIYIATLTVKDSRGGSSTKTFRITVSPQIRRQFRLHWKR